MTARDLLDSMARDARTAERADPETATAHDSIAAKHAARAEALERALALCDAAARYVAGLQLARAGAASALVVAVREWEGVR